MEANLISRFKPFDVILVFLASVSVIPRDTMFRPSPAESDYDFPSTPNPRDENIREWSYLDSMVNPYCYLFEFEQVN